MYTEVEVYLKDITSFYSKYGKDKLNQELYDYICNECYGEYYKNNIKINIYTEKELSDEEKRKMMDIIRSTFGLRVQDELAYYENSKDIKAILFLIGIALIILYYIAHINFLKEIILILGWLAIWESTYSFLTDSKKDYIRIYRLRQLSNSRVYFFKVGKKVDGVKHRVKKVVAKDTGKK